MLNRRAFTAALVASAVGLLVPERKVWALDQTMLTPSDDLWDEIPYDRAIWHDGQWYDADMPLAFQGAQVNYLKRLGHESLWIYHPDDEVIFQWAKAANWKPVKISQNGIIAYEDMNCPRSVAYRMDLDTFSQQYRGAIPTLYLADHVSF